MSCHVMSVTALPLPRVIFKSYYIILYHVVSHFVTSHDDTSQCVTTHHILLNHITLYHITYFHFTILSYSFSLTEFCIHWGRLERQRGKYCTALPWRIVRYSLSIGASQNVNMNMRALYCDMLYYAPLLVIVRDFSFVNFNMTIITILNVFQLNFHCTYHFIPVVGLWVRSCGISEDISGSESCW